jgi:tRNA threonylcarbamoyladenosine biosynthesis protein TsaB
MNILALEFSSSLRSVSILRSTSQNPALLAHIEDSDYRTVTPMLLIDRTFKQASLLPSEIQAIAVGLGPGSYTGIRSAIAIAQGWQLATKVDLIGISTVDVLAAQARDAGIRGELSVVIDAQRNELYIATFLITDVGIDAVSPLTIKPIAQAKSESRGIIIGPEASKWFPTGAVMHPSATKLAHLALKSRVPTPGELLEPIYLRELAFVKAPPSRVIQ